MFTIVSVILGLILFVYLVRQVGPEDIYTCVSDVGSGFILIIVLSATRPMIRSWAWLRVMTTEERKVGFYEVWRARLIGDAMGNLTTAGPLVAEPFRIKSLSGKLPLVAGISSLTVETLIYAISSCGMVLAGTILFLNTFAMSESLQVASLIALSSILLIVVATVVVVTKRQFLISGLGVRLDLTLKLMRLNIRLEQQVEYLARLDKRIFDLYAQRSADFFLVLLCQALFHLAGIAETYITLYLIGSNPTLQAAFIFEAINRAVNIAFNFIPARLGVDEAGSGLLAPTLGMGASVGVTLAILRKARVLFWSALGLLLLANAARTRAHVQL